MERPKSSPRGTYDILPASTIKSTSGIPASNQWFKVENLAKNILISAGFQEIRTPIFEATEIFSRAAGESSDIVNKEMYTFEDRSQRSLTLRPEGTAGVVRALLSNGLDRASKPLKLWYYGPMFRYERSQTGRYRQFTQLGAETFGSASPKAEFESIQLAWQIFEKLGIKELTLELNSVGDLKSREAFSAAMKGFLQDNIAKICPDCQQRMHTNPLRALDCKVPEDQALYQEAAPKLADFLTPESLDHQKELLNLLQAFGIDYKINSHLVRGLDYYTDTVFEIKSADARLGVQSTICAGGRYDALVKQFGGPEMPAFGWAMGMERLMLLLGDSESQAIYDDFLIYASDDEFIDAYKKVAKLRDEGKIVGLDLEARTESKQRLLAGKLLKYPVN
jgi:histidyl-tRNA synthetase